MFDEICFLQTLIFQRLREFQNDKKKILAEHKEEMKNVKDQRDQLSREKAQWEVKVIIFSGCPHVAHFSSTKWQQRTTPCVLKSLI
jgi:hypothetical protein